MSESEPEKVEVEKENCRLRDEENPLEMRGEIDSVKKNYIMFSEDSNGFRSCQEDTSINMMGE